MGRERRDWALYLALAVGLAVALAAAYRVRGL